MSSRRLSVGGRHSVLSDASSYQNSSSASRRMSMGGKSSETPKKDRLAMLDEWRRQSRNKEHQHPPVDEEIISKRARTDCPPLPPSSRPTFETQGTTALERFRMRKALRQNGNLDDTQISSFCYEEHEAPPLVNSQRRSSISLGPMRNRTSILPEEMDFKGPEVDNSPMDTVEDAGLRSQIREMQFRVDQLEKEKMALSMSKAPLEARFRQKEDAWMKEHNRLILEIDELKQANREANERNRDIEAQLEAIEEECRQLRLEVRKASSSLHTTAVDSTTWSRHLQNDRDVAELKSKLRNAEEEIDSIRLAKVSIEKELHATKIELDALIRNYDELQVEYEEISKSTSDNQEAEIKLQHLTTEHIATSAQLNAVCADLAATKARAEATLAATEEEFKLEREKLHFELSVLKTRAANANVSSEEMMLVGKEDDAVLRARLEEKDRRIGELEVLLIRGEEQRRALHNQIQELRGNIRVYVRTRPFLPDDGQSNDPAIDVSPDGESLSIMDSRTGSPFDFKFDKVFPPSAGQDMVFQEVADFVQSALDGYQVCLFSYGQTGSGKTHTMQGSGNGAMRGIIPRAVEQILNQAKILHSQKWNFHLSASFLEIYNEDLNDLLLSMNKDSGVMKNPPKLAIKRSREGKSFVDGLTEVQIETNDSILGIQQLEALMDVAARTRSVASTKMNSQSSRSHSVFMLHLRGYNEESGAEVQGTLNLCDLAGSERLDRSGANSDAKRLRETQAINKSLSCLGDVFNALAQRASHVPFRNSKLTYLLQDCLSGDGKALMFVNLSPTAASSNESLCSLRFAQRVNQVELGKPTKNIQYIKR